MLSFTAVLCLSFELQKRMTRHHSGSIVNPAHIPRMSTATSKVETVNPEPSRVGGVLLAGVSVPSNVRSVMFFFLVTFNYCTVIANTIAKQ